MEGQMSVDNPGAVSAPAEPVTPVTPATDPVAPVTPADPATPVVPTEPVQQTFQPGDPGILQALLDGADPNTLFATPTDPAATPAEPNPPATQTPAAPPVDPGQGMQIPDKFKNADGTVNTEAVLRSYTELERAFGEQGQKLGKFSQEVQQLRGLVGQPQQPAQQPAQPAQPAEPAAPVEEAPLFPWEVEMTPEEKEKALEEYYADPLAVQAKRDQQAMKAMEYRIQKTLEKVLSPLAPIVKMQEYEAEVGRYGNQLLDFAKVNPDVQEMLPAMQTIAGMMSQDVIAAMEKAGQNPLNLVYQTAKALYKPDPAPAPTVDQMLTDPNIRQKILSDSGIQAEIRKGYVQDIKQGAPPVVIGAQPGGSPPATPSEKPRSVREASTIFSRFLKQQ